MKTINLFTKTILLLAILFTTYSCDKNEEDLTETEFIQEESVLNTKVSPGTQMIISPSTPVPPGWVIVASRPGINNTIRYVVGSRTGTQVRVLPFSPIPSGWVIVASRPGRDNTIRFNG